MPSFADTLRLGCRVERPAWPRIREPRMKPTASQDAAPRQPFDGARELATIRAALGGDAVARQRLFDGLVDLPAMLRVKNQRLGQPLRPHELDDVLQNVLLSLWQKLTAFDGRAPLLHWAYGFGVVEIRRAVERRGRRREQPIVDEATADPATEPLHDPERVRQLLAGLDPDEQAVIRLKHFEALTFDEIADRLGIVANTAKTRYYRGLERLRQRLLPDLREAP